VIGVSFDLEEGNGCHGHNGEKISERKKQFAGAPG
jgi:hypothetical protein